MKNFKLRPLTAQDAADIFNGRRQPSWADDFPTEGDVAIAGLVCRRIAAGEEFKEATAERPWSIYLMCIDGLVIGGAGFKHAPDADGNVEIGYGVTESHQGRGIATAAVSELVSYAHNHNVTVVAETEEWNIASIKVLQRVGFESWPRTDEAHLWWRLPAPGHVGVKNS